IETSVNIADQANIERVLPIARQRNLGVIAKRPIANAAWKREELPGLYHEYAKPYQDRLRRMNLTTAELGFSGQPPELWPEIALRFTLSQPGVHTAIIGTTNLAHVKTNLEAVEKGALPETAMRQLREAFRRAESASG